jgi:hypothetical protein
MTSQQCHAHVQQSALDAPSKAIRSVRTPDDATMVKPPLPSIMQPAEWLSRDLLGSVGAPGRRTLHPLDVCYLEKYAASESTMPAVADAGMQEAAVMCPLCGGPLTLNLRRRAGRQYFRHDEQADEARCPLSTSSYQPEGMSIAHKRDPLVEVECRQRFLRHWRRHYRLMRQTAPSVTLRRFTELIEYADVMNLWSYERLDERDLPYVLLVLAEFMTVHDESGESTRERFWFDRSVRDVGDLWSEQRTSRARLFRMVYREPLHTPFPTAADMLHWECVEQIDRLKDMEGPGISRADVRAFDQFVERNAAARLARRAGGRDE